MINFIKVIQVTNVMSSVLVGRLLEISRALIFLSPITRLGSNLFYDNAFLC